MKPLFRPTSFKRIAFFFSIDLFLSLITLYLAYELRFNFEIPKEFLGSFWLTFVVLVGAKLFFFFVFKNYLIIWRFFGFYDAKNIVKAHIGAYAFFIFFYLAFKEDFAPFPRSVIVIDFFLSLIFIGSVRVMKRIVLEGKGGQSLKRTLVVGTSSKTSTIIQSALKREIDYYPVAIMATQGDEVMTHAYINNVKVYDSTSLERIIKEKSITAVILTEKLPQEELRKLVDTLNRLG